MVAELVELTADWRDNQKVVRMGSLWVLQKADSMV
jgi:hypothetical protein